jgi:hypothetical protein
VSVVGDKSRALWRIRLLHTVIWAVFAGSILAIPFATALGDLRLGFWLSLFVGVEVVVLLVNGMRCPLTDLAGRYTEERPDGFDIFLPAWLARNNKLIFGTLWVAAELFLAGRWLVG